MKPCFDCLPNSLLIAKRHAYEFDKTSTEYLKDYLSHPKLKIRRLANGQIYYMEYRKAHGCGGKPYFVVSK